MKVDWVVVGAGLTGATIAERLTHRGDRTVLVVDQRDHVAGNAWDEPDTHGVMIHRYGPHIFHTNSKDVWEYLSRFTEWRPYEHRVLASVDGQLVPLPFNLDSIERLFPRSKAQRLIDKLVDTYRFGSRVTVLSLRNADDDELRDLGEFVYRKVFVQYTSKQWGMRLEDLSPSVAARVPIVVSRDDRYFHDTYQAMPRNGYGSLVRRMLAQRGIRLMLNTRWQDVQDQIQFDRLIFTGPIDEYFEYRHGPLPYRSLRFEFEHHATERLQSAAVINYPNDYDFTRITEVKWLTGQNIASTTAIKEFPVPHEPGITVPYYPIPTDANRQLYSRYEADAHALEGRVIFAGRLGDYSYYNMDQAVARALKIHSDLVRQR